MSWEHATEARAALNAIVNDPEHGVAALSSAQTMSNLLKDLLPDAPREKSILVAAAEAGLANNLRQHVDQGMDPNTAIRLTASSFSSTTPFTPDACTWVTGEIATALGIRHTGGQPGGGQLGGGTPSGFDAGQQGMPTQIAPIPGAGYSPGQQPTQGFGQSPGQGGGYVGGQAGQATTPGPWQAGGAQGGGYGQPAQPGQPGGGPAGWRAAGRRLARSRRLRPASTASTARRLRRPARSARSAGRGLARRRLRSARRRPAGRIPAAWLRRPGGPDWTDGADGPRRAWWPGQAEWQ